MQQYFSSEKNKKKNKPFSLEFLFLFHPVSVIR